MSINDNYTFLENLFAQNLSPDSFSSGRYNARLTLHNGQPEVWTPHCRRDSGNISPEVCGHYSGKKTFRHHFICALIILERPNKI